MSAQRRVKQLSSTLGWHVDEGITLSPSMQLVGQFAIVQEEIRDAIDKRCTSKGILNNRATLDLHFVSSEQHVRLTWKSLTSKSFSNRPCSEQYNSGRCVQWIQPTFALQLGQLNEHADEKRSHVGVSRSFMDEKVVGSSRFKQPMLALCSSLRGSSPVTTTLSVWSRQANDTVHISFEGQCKVVQTRIQRQFGQTCVPLHLLSDKESIREDRRAQYILTQQRKVEQQSQQQQIRQQLEQQIQQQEQIGQHLEQQIQLQLVNQKQQQQQQQIRQLQNNNKRKRNYSSNGAGHNVGHDAGNDGDCDSFDNHDDETVDLPKSAFSNLAFNHVNYATAHRPPPAKRRNIIKEPLTPTLSSWLQSREFESDFFNCRSLKMLNFDESGETSVVHLHRDQSTSFRFVECMIEPTPLTKQPLTEQPLTEPPPTQQLTPNGLSHEFYTLPILCPINGNIIYQAPKIPVF